jgi:hypothetical protein
VSDQKLDTLKPSIELDEEQTIIIPEPDAATHFPDLPVRLLYAQPGSLVSDGSSRHELSQELKPLQSAHRARCFAGPAECQQIGDHGLHRLIVLVERRHPHSHRASRGTQLRFLDLNDLAMDGSRTDF